ncbi:magnesium-dependent phosphatase-1 [Infirmifilum sp. SLHALR2]|nr:MAG: magnesium-dependent phosphatase-1 [Thermofilum sp. NZ13]
MTSSNTDALLRVKYLAPPHPTHCVKVLILDLDRTLWSHHDVTTTVPPYRRVSEDAVVDSRGDVIRLNPCAKDLLELAKSMGVKLAVASWNSPDKALQALETLGLSGWFDVVVVEPHPNKDRMIRKILKALRLAPQDAVFVDDNPAICDLVKRSLPEVNVLNIGADVESLCEVKTLLERNQQ